MSTTKKKSIAETPDFGGVFTLAEGAAKPSAIGDVYHWTVTYNEIVTGIEAVKTAEDVNASQSGFAEVMSRLMVVTESYPELKSHPLYQSFMKDVNAYEDKVRMSRMVYNDSATKLNRYVRQWPSSFVAGMLHFDIVEYIKIDDEGKRQAPVLFPNQNVPNA